MAPPPASPRLSSSQLELLGRKGEERTAAVGDVLYQVGDRTYPFIAIVEGEVTIYDAAGHEIIRHGASGFLGEMNLLSGQTVFLTAVVTQALRYIAVNRDVLKRLLFEDGPLSDLVLGTFIARRETLQRVQGIGIGIIGPHSSPTTMRMLDFARSNRLPFSWLDPAHDRAAADIVEGLDEASLPVVRLPGEQSCEPRQAGRCPARWGSASNWLRRKRSTCWGRRRARWTCRGRLRRVGGARHPRHRGQGARRTGRDIPPDRELSRISCRHLRHGAHRPCCDAGAEVRRSHRQPVPRAVTGAGGRPLRRPPRGRPRGARTNRAACNRRRLSAPPGGLPRRL